MAAESVLSRGEFALFRNWCETLPEEEIKARPLLSIYQATALLLSGGQTQSIARRLSDAESHEPTARVLAGISAVKALLATVQGDAKTSKELSTFALQTLPDEMIFHKSALVDNQAMVRLLEGDVDGAIEMFEKAAALEWLLEGSNNRVNLSGHK